MMLVPKEPNEEQRQEVAEAKSDNDAGTIKTGLAAICAVVAFACSLVGIWAAATEHYSTLITVVVGGMISFAVARWLGWQPKQIRRTTDLLNKLSALPLPSQSPPSEGHSVPPDEQSKAEQFEAQHDIVAKELVRTKLELERLRNEEEQRRLETTKLQHDNSTDEAPTEKLTEDRGAPVPKEPDDPKRVVYPPGFFHSGYGNLWTEYTEDVFDGIIWHWQYNAHIDNTPRNLFACCIECQKPMKRTPVFHGTSGRPGYFVQVTCERHAFSHVQTDPHGIFIHIRERIEKRLEDGSWVDVVDRQRMARGQPSIRGPIETIEKPPLLEEMATHILQALRFEGGECEEPMLYAALNFLVTNAGDPDVDRVAYRYHLQELEKQDFILLQSDLRGPDSVALTQKGRKYTLDNKL